MSDFAPSGALWEEIAKIALLGTERAAWKAPSGEASSSTTLESLLQSLDASNRECALLGAAALVGLHHRAGALPLENAAPLPEPCAEEDRQAGASRASDFLAIMLGGTNPEHLQEWLRLTAATGRRVPFGLLPSLLSKGRQETAIRSHIAPVLGRRGVWLASQNTDWKWALKEAGESGESDLSRADDIWQTGTNLERLQLLRDLRTVEPAPAIALVESTWAQESPDDRVLFIGIVETGLSLDDELFLEHVLEDKRKDVRTKAAELLASLPASQLVARMIERLRPLMKWTPGKAHFTPQFEVELPNTDDKTFAKALERDGIDLKTSHTLRGPKASALIQMISCVPPQFWCDEWKTTPEEVLEVVHKSEWKTELSMGLIQSALRFRDANWAQAILLKVKRDNLQNQEGALWNVLTEEQRDALLLECLSGEAQLHDAHPALAALSAIDTMWSEAVSRAVLAAVRRRIGQEAQSAEDGQKTASAAGVWYLQQAIRGWARFIPRHLIGEWALLIHDPALLSIPTSNLWHITLRQFTQSLNFRADMLEALRE